MSRTVLHVALVALVAACGGDVDEQWQLAHDRIIAVRAEPPGILPGEQSRVELLLGYEMGLTEVRSPTVATVVSPASMADAMAIDAGTWIVTAPSAERLAAAREELGLMPEAPVPLQIGVAQAWPTPVVSPDPSFNGFAATKTIWLGESRANPELTGLTIGGVEAPPAGTEVVISKVGETRLTVDASEDTNDVNWLTSCGEMRDFDLPGAYMIVNPEDPVAGELAVVLRDFQGGVSWRVWPVRAE